MPVDLTLEVAEQRLCNGSTLNDKTELSGSDVILALKLRLEATNLNFRGQFIVKATALAWDLRSR